MILEKVKAAIEKYEMLSSVRDVTVALSGGADSVCLLHLLVSLKDIYNIKVSAIHINHNLRGEESDRDEDFVKELCQRLNVPLKVLSIKVKELSEKTDQSIELAARNARYEAFKKYGVGVVATAHTASDNLETVLFNIARGSGLKGICGIPAKRDIYIRPLIFCTRQEIEAYICKNNLSYVTDSTNLTDDYSRNLIRHKAVPVLKKLNSSVEGTIINMCESLKEDLSFLEATAKEVSCSCETENGLDVKKLENQHISVVKRVLSSYFTKITGSFADSIHTERMIETLYKETKNSLPKGFYCDVKNGLFVIKKEGQPSKKTYNTEIFFKDFKNTHKVNNLLLKNIVDCDTIVGDLKVRTRLEGDSIKLKGRNCTKSLKKLFSELKIPTEDRDSIPVASDDEGIVWVYGVGSSQRNAVTSTTKKIIEFKTDISGEHKND